jgi:hypothetical protein
MSRDVSPPDFYRGKINLWVEDKATKSYLDTIWGGTDVLCLIAGGNEGVRAVAKEAEEAGYANVFGLIDRDFRASNKSAWFDPNKTFKTFVLPMHEIENYLLDAEALAGSAFNNLLKTAEQIVELVTREAKRRIWWEACREVVHELRRRFRDDFLMDPPRRTDFDENAARSHICESVWFTALAEKASRTNETEIHAILSKAHLHVSRRVEDETWMVDFSGKEILRDVGSRICDQTKPEISRLKLTPSNFDSDLAKQVGRWQVEHSRVHKDLTDLLAALKQRIATSGSSS